MNIKKVNAWLFGAVVVQLALVAFLWTRGHDSDATAFKSLLEHVDVNTVSEVTVESKDERVVLTKRDDQWVLSSGYDFPVKENKVDEVLAGIARIRSRASMTENVERHAQLGVATKGFNKKVTLTSGDKSEVFWVGNAAGGRRTSVRIGESAEVFAAEGVQVGDWSSRLSQWVDTKLFEGDSEHVRDLKIAKADGHVFHFAKKEGEWSVTKNGTLLAPPKGKELDTSLVSGMVSTLMNLRLVEPADPTLSVEENAGIELVFTAPQNEDEDSALQSVAAPTIQFKIGQQNESNRLISQSDAKPPVWVASAALEKVMTLDGAKLWRDAAKPKSDEMTPSNAMPNGLPPGVALPPGMQMQ